MPEDIDIDELTLDDLIIEEQYRFNDSQQREALRAEIQIYLFKCQKDLTNDQINHAVQMIVEIDKKHQEIIIENFERIKEVLDECQSLMAMGGTDDFSKLDLKDFKDEEQNPSQAKSKQSQSQQQTTIKKSPDAKKIIEELKTKIVEQQKNQKDMYHEKFNF